MKNFSIASLALGSALALSSCTATQPEPSDSKTPASSEGGETIAVFTKNQTNPFFQTVRVAAENAAKQMNATVIQYVPTKADDIPEQMNQMRAQMPTAGRVQDVSAQAAWWSFLGVVLSLGAAIGGALASAGPNPVFGGVLFRRTTPEPTPGV